MAKICRGQPPSSLGGGVAGVAGLFLTLYALYARYFVAMLDQGTWRRLVLWAAFFVARWRYVRQIGHRIPPPCGVSHILSDLT
jgi:hypothetical protein